MKKLLFLLLFPFIAYGQATESEIKSDIDAARVLPLTPARVYNILDKINYGKQSIKGIYTATGTNTYAVTAGAGINNNDANIIIVIRFLNANTTGPATLNVNGNGAMPLKTNLGSDHDVGGICAGCYYEIASTGTTWQVIGPTNEGGEITTDYGEIGGIVSDQIDLYDTLNTRARRWYKVKTVSSNYTAALGDENNKLIVVNGGANFEIPKDADVDFPNGSALLTADSLETATYSKDAAVTLDTVDTHVWIKVANDRWITPRASSGGGSGAYWPLSGTGTLTGNNTIDVDGHALEIGDTDGGLTYQSGLLGMSGTEYSAVFTDGTNTSSIEIFPGLDMQIAGTTTFSGNDIGNSFQINNGHASLVSNNSTDDTWMEVQVGAGTTPTSGAFSVLTGSALSYTSKFGIKHDGQILIASTNTAGGTTGNQTINKAAGTVNFAAAATSLTVTNSLCTTSSIVFAVIRTNDTTAVLKNVVPGSGSFVINLNAAATAETSVGWWIIN